MAHQTAPPKAFFGGAGLEWLGTKRDLRALSASVQ
jgi:hypothetical protein